jgi:chemotaxis protein CheC
MASILTPSQCRLLCMIFERGAECASQALSKWLGQEVQLTVSEAEQVDLASAAEVLGPPERLVAACSMGLSGLLSGQILLVFEERVGLGLVDRLLHQPLGTATKWGELEQSALQETTNIVGCAYLNSLAAHLPGKLSKGDPGGGELLPTPPAFLREFAGSLIEFALMEQAIELDQVVLAQTGFAMGQPGADLCGTLLFVPDRPSLHALATALAELESHPHAR